MLGKGERIRDYLKENMHHTNLKIKFQPLYHLVALSPNKSKE